jgi:hypothetical protein
VSHFAYDFNEACYKVRTLNVFMSFVEAILRTFFERKGLTN